MKTGRPPIDPASRKTYFLTVRLTEDEGKLVDGAAEKKGQKPRTWAREALLKAVKR